MEKIQDGNLKAKDVIEQDLRSFKFQKITGGKSTKFIRLEEKNGKKTLHFADGSSTDFKLLEERYIRLSLVQPDFTPEQIQQLVETRRKKAKESGVALLKEEVSLGEGENGQVSEVTLSPIVSQRPELSPLQQLLKKQKENLVSLNLNLKINLPPKALFAVLLESYDNAEEEILNFSVAKVDIESIKNSIKEAIKKNYYQSNGEAK